MEETPVIPWIELIDCVTVNGVRFLAYTVNGTRVIDPFNWIASGGTTTLPTDHLGCTTNLTHRHRHIPGDHIQDDRFRLNRKQHAF